MRRINQAYSRQLLDPVIQTSHSRHSFNDAASIRRHDRYAQRLLFIVVEKSGLVAPGCLACVKRLVRTGDQRAQIADRASLGQPRRETERWQPLPGVNDRRFCNLFAQCINNLHGFIVRCVGADDGEFLAPKARRINAFAVNIAQMPAQHSERGVAGIVAVFVVERIEMVDIEHRYRQRLVQFVCAAQFGCGHVQKPAAVLPAFERIFHRFVLQFGPQAHDRGGKADLLDADLGKVTLALQAAVFGIVHQPCREAIEIEMQKTDRLAMGNAWNKNTEHRSRA